MLVEEILELFTQNEHTAVRLCQYTIVLLAIITIEEYQYQIIFDYIYIKHVGFHHVRPQVTEYSGSRPLTHR